MCKLVVVQFSWILSLKTIISEMWTHFTNASLDHNPNVFVTDDNQIRSPLWHSSCADMTCAKLCPDGIFWNQSSAKQFPRYFNWRAHKLFVKCVPGSYLPRLLHSHSLVAAGAWGMALCHSCGWLVGLWIEVSLICCGFWVNCNALWAPVTDGNFHHFSKPTDSPLLSPNAVQAACQPSWQFACSLALTSISAVQGDCVIVYYLVVICMGGRKPIFTWALVWGLLVTRDPRPQHPWSHCSLNTSSAIYLDEHNETSTKWLRSSAISWSIFFSSIIKISLEFVPIDKKSNLDMTTSQTGDWPLYLPMMTH